MKRLFLALLLSLAPLSAFAAQDWDGSWVGNWQTGDGVQIIIIDSTIAGMYWRGGYLDDNLRGEVSGDGKSYVITWSKSRAVLTHASDRILDITIHEPGRPDVKFPLSLDH